MQRRLVTMMLVLILVGCDRSPIAPPPPPPPPESALPREVAYLAGVYDVTMTVEKFDSAWGDFTGHRCSGVLTLVDGAGSFRTLRCFDAAGEIVSASSGGSVTPSVFLDRIVLRVGSSTSFVVNTISEPEQGQTASPRFAGTYAMAVTNGSFVATQRTPEG